MLFLACSPLSVGFGRSSICLKAEEEATASNTQSAQSSQRSLGPELVKRVPVFFRGTGPWSEALGTGPRAFSWASSANAMWGVPLTGGGTPELRFVAEHNPKLLPHLILKSFKRNSWQWSYLVRHCQALNNRGLIFKCIHLLRMALFCFAQIKIAEHVKCCSCRRVAGARVEFLLLQGIYFNRLYRVSIYQLTEKISLCKYE